jgi:hypothetical protein
MSGLVISDMGGGDFVVNLLDDPAWDQIAQIPDLVESYAKETGRTYVDVFGQWVAWLAFDDSDEEDKCPKPAGCPEREGRITHTWYCQAPVIEKVGIADNISGIVFLPSGY